MSDISNVTITTFSEYRPARLEVLTIVLTIQVFRFMTTGRLEIVRDASEELAASIFRTFYYKAYWKRDVRLKGRQISSTSIQCFHR